MRGTVVGKRGVPVLLEDVGQGHVSVVLAEHPLPPSGGPVEGEGRFEEPSRGHQVAAEGPDQVLGRTLFFSVIIGGRT